VPVIGQDKTPAVKTSSRPPLRIPGEVSRGTDRLEIKRRALSRRHPHWATPMGNVSGPPMSRGSTDGRRQQGTNEAVPRCLYARLKSRRKFWTYPWDLRSQGFTVRRLQRSRVGCAGTSGGGRSPWPFWPASVLPTIDLGPPMSHNSVRRSASETLLVDRSFNHGRLRKFLPAPLSR
jgi:hypothetical protein